MSQSLLYVPERSRDSVRQGRIRRRGGGEDRRYHHETNGRAFMLFTSYRMLRAVFDRLVDTVPFRLRAGRNVNDRLIKEFREDESTA